ncbi:unnamed protein product [Dovyalis caffra]|uniref:Uncharacterized protein n=1 Tax=Dovyalis caffra TaxID=77055 RepID=A0AAV1SCC1_9ROSI|nr:unnamed protein product [Dovyalis caffra]
MEDDGMGGGPKTQRWWWWAMGSMAQLGWGISSYKKGRAGDPRHVPSKACIVASLFLGSVAQKKATLGHWKLLRMYNSKYLGLGAGLLKLLSECRLSFLSFEVSRLPHRYSTLDIFHD